MRPVITTLRLTPEEHKRLREKAERLGLSGHSLIRATLAPILSEDPGPFDRLRAWYLSKIAEGIAEERAYLTRKLAALAPLIEQNAEGTLLRRWLEEQRDDLQTRLRTLDARTPPTQEESP